LASDSSMEFLLNGSEFTPRSSGLYSYPPSRNRNSLVRSSSLSEIISPSESIRDDSSVLPGDSISLRPAQVYRTRGHTAVNLAQSTSTPLDFTRNGLSVGGVGSPSSSYMVSAAHSNAESTTTPSLVGVPSQPSDDKMEPFQSPGMLGE